MATILLAAFQLAGVRYVIAQQFCAPASSPFSASDLSTYPLVNQSSKMDSVPASFASTSVQEVQDYIVKKHNCLRTLVSPSASNMLTIQWNAEAAQGAQQHANNCVFQHNANTNRSTSQFSSCGQNIAMNSGGSPMSWKTVIDMWYNEVASCSDGTAVTCSSTAGHYTQIVWAKTWQIGCGFSSCGGKMNFFVCNYCPAGNFNGQLPYVRGPPCSACPNNCVGGRLCNNPCQYTDVYSNCGSLMAGANACSTSNYKNSCKATCLCGGNNGLSNRTSTLPSSPSTTTKSSTTPTTKFPTPDTPPSIADFSPTSPTFPTPTMPSPTPGDSSYPTGYDQCDTTFCTGKMSKLYEVWPCSRYLCYCNANIASLFNCNAGTYFDGSTGSCKAGNSTWCPLKSRGSVPPPTAWPPAPDSMVALCSAKNCVGRAGTGNNWFGLGTCSPYWCMCFSGTSRAVQACPAGQYMDVRPESLGCTDSGTLPYC
ncbi:hypothetical protein RvY_02110 [Ramazzottius varieornatus]|uniref:ShKT domain-containing protein n=1 Tax=Ramazzottius varieornatus TaxID=947166 RepID=A0A1D1UMD3_RAMVA|nr:hypothetical protein RvY_02110 [Ramazzottius varieornatus]